MAREDPYDFVLAAVVKRNPQDGTYVCAVAKHKGKKLTVCAVGIEATESDAARWGAATIRLMREKGTQRVQAPDMHDRAQQAMNTRVH